MTPLSFLSSSSLCLLPVSCSSKQWFHFLASSHLSKVYPHHINKLILKSSSFETQDGTNELLSWYENRWRSYTRDMNIAKVSCHGQQSNIQLRSYYWPSRIKYCRELFNNYLKFASMNITEPRIKISLLYTIWQKFWIIKIFTKAAFI